MMKELIYVAMFTYFDFLPDKYAPKPEAITKIKLISRPLGKYLTKNDPINNPMRFPCKSPTKYCLSFITLLFCNISILTKVVGFPFDSLCSLRAGFLSYIISKRN